MDWLEAARSPQGYWGVEDVAVTALSMLAVARWRPLDAQKRLAAPAMWLTDQSDHGAWETPWDTAVALQALHAAGHRSHPTAEAARRHVRSLDTSNEQVWGQGVHHAAQVLRALNVAGADSLELEQWSWCVQRHLSPDQDIYVCAQAVYALIESGTVDPDEIRDEIDLLAGYLQHGGRPSEGGLRDYAPAVQALSVIPAYGDLVAETVGSILAAYTDKRAWYRDPRHTAWALIAIHEAGQVAEVVIDKPHFNRAFATAFREIPTEQRRERVMSALWAAALVAQLAVAAAVVALWNESESLIVNGVLIGALSLSIPFSMRSLVRHVSGGP